MATLLTMPKLGMTMEEGTVHAWFKQEGEPVEEGEPLLSVLTDKIDIEVEAPVSGVLRKILVQQGETVPINTPIAVIAEADEDITALLAQAGAGNTNQASADASPSGEGAGAPPDGREERVRATPVARRLAREHGVDLAVVPGSGPRGRVTRADVEEHLAGLAVATRPAAAPQPWEAGPPQVRSQAGLEAWAAGGALPLAQTPPVPPEGPRPASSLPAQPVPSVREARPVPPEGPRPVPALPAQSMPSVQQRTPLAGRRRVIARRMSESAFTAPHVTLTTEADVTELVHLRRTLNEADRARGGPGISYLDLFIVIAARALARHPYMNARLEGDDIVVEPDVHIGIAVDHPDGLLVPVIRDVLDLSVGAVARRRAAVVQGARGGTLTPDQLAGGTFTITNLGAYDIDGFTPIINPPQAAILGMGRIVEKPAVYQGQVCVRSMMTLSLSFDHRIVDGAPAAAFLQTTKRLAEQPALLHL